MTLTLYYYNLSPYSRAVMMCIKALDLKVNLVVVNSYKGETKKPEFVAINPVKELPTLVDGDFTLWESKAIMTYLVAKYGKDDSLYPSDIQKRAEIDKLLFFDQGTLFSRFMKAYYPVYSGVQATIDEDKAEKNQEGLGFLNQFLEGKKFVTGDNVTVADWALVTSVYSMNRVVVDISRHKNVVQWLERCKELPYFAEAQDGIEEFTKDAIEKLNRAH